MYIPISNVPCLDKVKCMLISRDSVIDLQFILLMKESGVVKINRFNFFIIIFILNFFILDEYLIIVNTLVYYNCHFKDSSFPLNRAERFRLLSSFRVSVVLRAASISLPGH